MNYKKLTLKEAKFIVFTDFGYNGGYTDLFEDEESAREFIKEFIEKDDYESITLSPIVEGLEIYGEIRELNF